MKPITAETKTLLKSGVQVGADGPSYSIAFEEPPVNSNFEWIQAQTIRGESNDAGTSWYAANGWGGGHFVTAANGRVLVCYVGPKADGTNPFCNVYLSYVDSEDQLFFEHNRAKENEWVFLQLPGTTDVKFLKLQSGKILLFVGVTGKRGITDYYYDCYISNNGTGDDFVYLSRMYTRGKNTFTHDIAHEMNVGIPLELDNGRVIVPGNHISTIWAYRDDVLIGDSQAVYYSDDGGQTWGHTIIYQGGLFRRPRGLISIAKWGDVLTVLVFDMYGMTMAWSYHSYDNGNTWAKGEQWQGPDGSTWAYRPAVSYGADGYNYMIMSEPKSTLYHVYRAPHDDTPPDPFFTVGDNTNPTGNGAAWEWLAGPLGDDAREHIFITENFNIAVAGTSIYGGGSRSYILGGTREKEKVNEYVKTIHISKSHGMTAGTAAIVLDNKGGFLAPDNIDSPWHHKLLPNRRVTIYQGYGAELVKTFTGYIDGVQMRTFPQEIVIECRDALKKALDQTIKQITYKDMTIENIVRNLAGRAGLQIGHIDATGLTIKEKTFEWESYADALGWCADLVAFEYFVDEDERFYFRAQEHKAEVDYIYSEGEDIAKLGYSIDDDNLYRKLYVTAENENGEFLHAEFVETHYSKLLRLPKTKETTIDIEKTKITASVLKEITNRIGKQMVNKVRRVEFEAIANPWLEVGDALQVIETSSTISNIYRILDIDLTQTNEGFTMKLTCYYYGNV